MQIDTELLKSLIASGVDSVSSPMTPWINEKTNLGEIKGVQIQLVVTSDEDEFLESQLSDACCVTE